MQGKDQRQALEKMMMFLLILHIPTIYPQFFKILKSGSSIYISGFFCTLNDLTNILKHVILLFVVTRRKWNDTYM